jgi:hypothetical protein
MLKALTCFITFITLFLSNSKLLSKDKAKNLQNLTLEKDQTALIRTIPYLNKTIQNSDNISLISNIGSLANLKYNILFYT